MCILKYQTWQIQPIFINLHPNEYRQELHYYPFVVKWDKCVGSCNTLNDLSKKVCVRNKTEDLNKHDFNMITGKKWFEKFLQKIYVKICKCKFDGRKCNSNQKWNNSKCQRQCRKHHIWSKKIYILNPATCNCENGKYLASRR